MLTETLREEVRRRLDGDVLFQLQEQGIEFQGIPADDQGEIVCLVSELFAYAQSWIAISAERARKAPPAAFILSRNVKVDCVAVSASLVDFFKESPEYDISGKAFFSTSNMLAVAELSEGAACGNLQEIAGLLRKHRLSGRSVILFIPQRAEMVACFDGIDGEVRPLIRVSEPRGYSPMSLDDLERRIWDFHEEFTQTPEGKVIPWRKSASDRVTSEELERRISYMLSFFLNIGYPRGKVKAEVFSPTGRADVLLEPEIMAPAFGPCVLELKVLRSRYYSSTDKRGWRPIPEHMQQWLARRGVIQARLYRKMNGAKEAYLCCFDARLSDADDPDLIRAAATANVRHKRYYMYSSTDDLVKAIDVADKAGVKLSGQVD